MKKWLTNYFGFTKREYNALLTLFGLIVVLIVTPYAYEHFFKTEDTFTDLERNAIQKLELNAVKELDRQNFRRRKNEVNLKPVYFKFNPNDIGIEEWKKLGLSAKQAQSILNYRNKGGKFYKVDDLKRMYAISPKTFEQLKPYVEIGATEQQSKEPKVYAKKEFISIEINGADTIKLDEIKGVGAAFARRIEKYRDRLGGFYKKEQLMEVYGIDSIKFAEIKSQITLDASLIRKININTADFDALKNHPYLKYKQINAIIQYRKQHGHYRSIDDLKKILILSPQTIEQITPYIQF